ncbi:MAG: oxygen-independent coproporphyrinogen III oxidase [Halioglobus sp.]|nr:oxygen-independent coproporphyrinogen III oxidase [Halioglobus sp.]
MHEYQQPEAGDSTGAIDLALAAKYSRPGPRYTSYPTAAQFLAGDVVTRYLDWRATTTVASAAPLSIYVHLPFCRDICYHCACNKVVIRERSAGAHYLQRLEREIARQSQLVGRHRPVTQLHWGGGTPTWLAGAELTRLMHKLATSFHLVDRPDREYSIEIDPRTAQPDTIALLRGLGFNRVSLGIQDFDPRVQQAVNRVQSPREVQELVDAARRHDFKSLGFDLIYGLPNQDRSSMTKTLERVVSLAPDRISCYGYAHLPQRFGSEHAIDRLSVPAAQERLLLQALIRRTLTAAGYIHIGMDQFVLSRDDLALAQRQGRLQRNFQGYSLRLADDTLGLGVSAISQIGDFYLQNTRDLEHYCARLEAGELPLERGCQLSREDRLRRHVIMSLICTLSLDMEACSRQFGIEFGRHFSNELGSLGAMAEDGLLTIEGNRISVTERGRPYLHNICMVFDAYLPEVERSGTPATHSMTV